MNMEAYAKRDRAGVETRAQDRGVALMKNEVFNLHGEWFVSFNGRTTGSWSERGPAEACLSQLKAGNGEITESGVVQWKRAEGQRD